ncbi:MAG TPA: hypothetical protein VF086_16050 [Propionibacteriaceae bacterium]
MILQARCIPLHGAPDPDLRHELQRILYGLIPSRSWQQWAAPWPQPRRIELAYITREIAADHLGLAAPARVIAMRAQGEAEVVIEQGETRFEGVRWVTPHQIAANQVISLPELARRGLVNAATDVAAATNQAVAAVAHLQPTEPAPPWEQTVLGVSA